MRFYDLFAGIGGFRLGFERAGHECVGSCEIDKYARQIYAKNFGHEPTERDATKINPSNLPYFDILCAGFPCQSFSIAGRRGGFSDTRGTLCFEILRIAEQRKPPILLLENVKGLLSHDKGKTFRIITESLDELGYDVEWQLLNSKYFVPQNRERIFIIGHLRGSGSRKILPVGEVRTEYVKSFGKTQDTKNRHSGAITSNYWKGYGAGRTMIAEPKVNIIGNKNPSGKGQGGNVFSSDGISPSLCAGGDNPERNRDVGYNSGYVAEPKIKLYKNSKDDSYRVYETDGIARTLRSNSGGLGSKTGVYNMGNYRFRKLTPKECERLQGFPDDFTSGVSDTQRYKMLGNAVTVNVTEYIGGLLRM